jgi:hypothetical protein
MLIASKYEEIYAPEIRDFVYVSDKSYNKADILSMEYDILSSLNFDILTVYPCVLLERYNFIANSDKKANCFSHYILELSLLEYKMLEYPSTMKAASALLLTRKILYKNQKAWNSLLELTTGYSELDLKDCTKDLLTILDITPKTILKSSVSKYSTKEYESVSTISIKDN